MFKVILVSDVADDKTHQEGNNNDEEVRDIGPSEQVGIIELQEDVSLLSEGELTQCKYIRK